MAEDQWEEESGPARGRGLVRARLGRHDEARRGEESRVRDGMGGARACGRGKVSEDKVSMEEGEGLGIQLKRRGFEDRVGDATGIGDGEVTPDQGLTSSTFAFVRGGVGDGTVNEV